MLNIYTILQIIKIITIFWDLIQWFLPKNIKIFNYNGFKTEMMSSPFWTPKHFLNMHLMLSCPPLSLMNVDDDTPPPLVLMNIDDDTP